jgi:hypothetical protein
MRHLAHALTREQYSTERYRHIQSRWPFLGSLYIQSSGKYGLSAMKIPNVKDQERQENGQLGDNGSGIQNLSARSPP